MIKKPLRIFLPALCALLLAVPAWRAAAQPRSAPPSREEIEAMKRELQEKQRDRERLSERKELIPLQDLAAIPRFNADPKFAYLRLSNTMNTLRAIWTLLPAAPGADPKKPEPIVAPLTFRGEQWLQLAPGAWLVQLETGRPDSDVALTMAPRGIELKAGRAYALEMNDQTEQQLRKVLGKMMQPVRTPGDAPKGSETALPDTEPAS